MEKTLVKPQKGMPLNLYLGLLTKITFGKDSFNLSERPQLRELFRPSKRPSF